MSTSSHPDSTGPCPHRACCRHAGRKSQGPSSPAGVVGLGILLVFVLLATSACAASPSPGPTAQADTTLIVPAEAAATVLPASPSPPAVRGVNLHPAEGAGRWYPADPSQLRSAVEALLSQAQFDPLPGRVLAVIVPHAGYVYSGSVASYAFRALQESGCSGQTIAVIGDTHTGKGSASVSVWAAGGFETPLGTIPVDSEVAQALLEDQEARGQIEFDRQAFQAEHPVENQLPFLQTVCPGARIVPVIIRKPTLENAKLLADALLRAISGRPALIVASTDLSHYHPYLEAQQMDQVALEAIISLDPQAVADSPRRCAELGLGGGEPLTMCSQGAVMTALLAAQKMGADRATVLQYANSGDVPIGQRDQVVGYGAVAIWASVGPNAEDAPPTARLPSPQSTVANPQHLTPLSPELQQELLALARRTAEQFLSTETLPAFRTSEPALLQPMGAYVTYEKDGMLRGCLGRLESDRPVYQNVQYAALAAALGDSRFPPVGAGELSSLSLEITLLHPLHEVHSPEEIQIGRDGVLMRIGEEGGALFLPQVPLDQGWDLAETLLNLCRKAGLPDDAWTRADARFYVFAGQWFGEED